MDVDPDVELNADPGRSRWSESLEPGRGGPQLIPRPHEVELDGAPAWAAAQHHPTRLSLADIAYRLDGLSIERSLHMVGGADRRSAVAIVLSEGAEGIEVLLTRRAWHMRTHRGEIAFPGGGEEHGDVFPVGTALREACEEVALDARIVSPIGALDPMLTVSSNRAVVPVVFATEQRPTVIESPDEVDAILHVSFRELLEPGCYRRELWTWNEPDSPRLYRHPVHFFELFGDTLWGATASMLNQLLTVVYAPEAFDRSVRNGELYGR